MKTAVIGIGSPFGDDDVAFHVVNIIKRKIKKNSDVTISYYDRPGLFLLECLKDYSIVHLIDAMVSDKPVGTICRYENIDQFVLENNLVSSHGFGVSEVLVLGKTMQLLPDQMRIHGIMIDQFSKIKVHDDQIAKLSDCIISEISQ